MDKALLNARSRTEWEALIHEWIHNEKDRWLITRRLLDGVPYDALTGEYQLKFEIPLEYDQIRRRCKAAEKQLKTHCK